MTADIIIHKEITETVVRECTFKKEKVVNKPKPKTIFCLPETEKSGS